MEDSLISALTISAVIVLDVIILVFLCLRYRSRYGRWKKDLDRLAKAMQRLPGVPTQVEYADIKKATNNFNETSTMLGKGGFGAVYRCKLPTPIREGEEEAVQEVAVKKFTRYHKQNKNDNRYDDFLAEVSVIHRLSHKNIVPLIGWSYHKGEPLLIYEYMSNGSLDQHLFRSDCTTLQQENMVLPWNTRYDIVRDIATGLRYIHEEHDPVVLHRDIKASNVMLDSNLRARLGDFGIACTVDVNKSSVMFNGQILGTWGYIAPEYAQNCQATRQSDIYAFGVLVLEIVSGRQWDDVKPEDDHIVDWVWRLHGQGKLLQAVDRSMVAAPTAEGNKGKEDVALLDEAERMLILGLACTKPDPSNRPSMADVLQVINKSAPPPHVPPERPPKFMPPPQNNLTRRSAAMAVEMVAQASEDEQPFTLSADVGNFCDSIV